MFHASIFNSTQLYCDIFAAQRAELLNTRNSTARSAINQKQMQWNRQNTQHAVRGAMTAEKLKGTKIRVPTPGRLRPAPGWVLGAGGGRPSRCEGPGVSPPESFCKLRC